MSKKIIVRQNWKGKYNIISGEETLLFIMDIVDDKHNTIIVDGVKARLQLNSDLEPFDSPEDDIYLVFKDCWEYAKSVWSNIDYKAQCLTFAKVFQENYEELCKSRVSREREEIIKEIKRLQNKLEFPPEYDDISYEVNEACSDEIKKYTKWLESEKKNLEQVKEDTDKYTEISTLIKKYQDKIDYYTNSKIEKCYYE